MSRRLFNILFPFFLVAALLGCDTPQPPAYEVQIGFQQEPEEGDLYVELVLPEGLEPSAGANIHILSGDDDRYHTFRWDSRRQGDDTVAFALKDVRPSGWITFIIEATGSRDAGVGGPEGQFHCTVLANTAFDGGVSSNREISYPLGLPTVIWPTGSVTPQYMETIHLVETQVCATRVAWGLADPGLVSGIVNIN